SCRPRPLPSRTSPYTTLFRSFAKALRAGHDRGLQGLYISGAAFPIADGIDVHFQIRNTDAVEKVSQHLEDLGLDSRIIGTGKHFGPGLHVLPVAALLRTLSTEHRSDVIELQQSGFILELVLDVCAHNGRRTFGAQGE